MPAGEIATNTHFPHECFFFFFASIYNEPLKHTGVCVPRLSSNHLWRFLGVRGLVPMDVAAPSVL